MLMATLDPVATHDPADAASIPVPLTRGLLNGGTQTPSQREDFNNHCQ
jgi:hypothetical protein